MVSLSEKLPILPLGPWTLLLLPVILLLSILTTVLYNLYLHPLRNHPGPTLWAATRAPWILHSLRGTLHTSIHALHTTHGPVIRIAPDEISYTTSPAYRAIYTAQPECPKDPLAQQATVNGAPSIVGANKSDHTRFRRLLSHAFSDRGLLDGESLIYHYVDLFISRLRESCTKHGGSDGTSTPLDMAAWYTFFTFDLIGDLAFGSSFDCLSSSPPTAHPWIEAIAGNVKSVPMVNLFRRYSLAWLIPYVAPRDLIRRRMNNYRFTKDKIERRIAQGGERGDFWDKVVSSISASASTAASEKGAERGGKAEPTTISPAEMISNASTLVIAGSETTATLLAGATYLLLTHPAKYRKLVSEVRARFATEADITIQSVAALPYLLAVLNESLRLYPPVPLNFNRIAPPGGKEICGRWVPERTSLTVPQYAIGRSAANFHRPEEFIPERFLPEDPEYEAGFAKDDHNALQPFVIGPRNCLGKTLALAEMRLVVARVMWGFEMELDDGQKGDDWLDQKVFLLWEKKPLWVRVRLRSGDPGAGQKPASVR